MVSFSHTDEIEGDCLPTLEMDEDVYVEQPVEVETVPEPDMDNPNEAVIPPYPSEVHATRLSDFRCGGGPVEYPAPHGLSCEPFSVPHFDTQSISILPIVVV